MTVLAGYGLAAHAGVTPWLQAVASVALIFAAPIALWAAVIALRSFNSQRRAADQQMGLAAEEAERQKAADLSTRQHASINLLFKFVEAWEGPKMLRWREHLARGLLEKKQGEELSGEARLGLYEVANLVDLVGYCVNRKLLFLDDAWEQFSELWEIYWGVSGDLVKPPPGDQTAWAWANELIGAFQKKDPDGGFMNKRTQQDIRNTLISERDRARIEELLLRPRPVPPETPQVTGGAEAKP